MSSAGLFESTIAFRSFLEVISKANSSGKLSGVVLRVASNTGKSGSAFTPEEVAEMPKALGLESEATVEQLEGGLCYIFETGAYHGASGTQLAEELLGVGMDEEVCGIVRAAWDRVGRDVLGRLRKRTMGGPAELDGVHIQTGVHLGHRGFTNGRDTGAVFEFHMASRASEEEASETKKTASVFKSEAAVDAAGGSPSEQVLSVDMSQDALLDFLVQMDGIQRQLDALGN